MTTKLILLFLALLIFSATIFYLKTAIRPANDPNASQNVTVEYCPDGYTWQELREGGPCLLHEEDGHYDDATTTVPADGKPHFYFETCNQDFSECAENDEKH